MKRLSLFLFSFLISHFSFSQMGSWRAYMSYQEPQQIVKAGANNLFVRASNGLYSYNIIDQSITTYDKVRQLSDTHISELAWNSHAQRLLIVYDNSNIDIMDVYGNVTNVNSIYAKSMTQDKTINVVFMNEQYAYLGTGFGVVKIDMKRAEISESYILGHSTQKVGIDDGQLYINALDTYAYVDYNTDNNTIGPGTVVSETVVEYTGSGDNKKPSKKTVIKRADYRGNLSKNLIDPHNWGYAETVPSGVYDVNNTDWEDNIETVKKLNPGGPKYNHFGFMRIKNNILYSCGGNGGGSLVYPATVQIKKGDEWEILQDDMTGVDGTGNGWTFVNMYAVDVDPFDSKHIYAGGRTGLFEYYDGLLVKYYNKDNSILNTATSSNKYVLTDGVTYDSKGSLWLLQSQVKDNSLIEITKDGEWVKHDQDVLMDGGLSLNGLKCIIFDSRELLWFINSHWSKPSFYCYDPTNDTMVYSISRFVNQDGTTYQTYNPHCIIEDLEGNIWIGTQEGPFMIESERVGGDIDYVTQVKVPRNDGTNYADYLLSNVNISCMSIDGGNRKWFGTNGAGVFLISADNMEQVYNFTASNSPLLSDVVESIVIDHETGEVFFGTDQGLCSFMSDATNAVSEMVKDDIYAYPNPVVSGYDGLITVVGLSYDSDVKILTTSGQLVAEGRSNGGTFTWNGRDRSGRRVATGVYMVCAATSNGEKGTVCKIAIIR